MRALRFEQLVEQTFVSIGLKYESFGVLHLARIPNFAILPHRDPGM